MSKYLLDNQKINNKYACYLIGFSVFFFVLFCLFSLHARAEDSMQSGFADLLVEKIKDKKDGASSSQVNKSLDTIAQDGFAKLLENSEFKKEKSLDNKLTITNAIINNKKIKQ